MYRFDNRKVGWLTLRLIVQNSVCMFVSTYRWTSVQISCTVMRISRCAACAPPWKWCVFSLLNIVCRCVSWRYPSLQKSSGYQSTLPCTFPNLHQTRRQVWQENKWSQCAWTLLPFTLGWMDQEENGLVQKSVENDESSKKTQGSTRLRQSSLLQNVRSYGDQILSRANILCERYLRALPETLRLDASLLCRQNGGWPTKGVLPWN